MVTKIPTLCDHNLLFCSTKKEKHNVMFSNLEIGLDKGCYALFITNGNSVKQIQVEMENFGLKLEPEKVKIVTSHQWYMLDGEFNAERVEKQYRRLVDEVVDRGFKGLYVSSDVTDTFDHHSKNLEPWLNYENSLGRQLEFPMEAICVYRTDQVESNSQALLQLIQAHKNTITHKTMKIIDNKELYMYALTETLSNILGEKATEVIFSYLTKNLEINRSQIPDKIQDVDNALESLLGKALSKIKPRIIKNIHGMIEL